FLNSTAPTQSTSFVAQPACPNGRNTLDKTASPTLDSPPSQHAPSDQIWNVPNALTMTRLVLAGGVGILIESGWYFSAMVAFIIAASTDFLDGWWARRFNQVTKLGRV